jgi:hypothetical protein
LATIRISISNLYSLFVFGKLMPKLSLALALSFASVLLGQNGYITTVAGNGTAGTSGVGGPATNASLSGGMISVDNSDNIYLADRANNRVVRVDAVTGILTLVAGNGVASSAGDGGPAAQASLNHPAAVVVDAVGNLYVSEAQGNRVRRIDAASGIITTYAGTGAGGWSGDGGPATSGTLYFPLGLALDSSGNLYIADAQNFRIRRVDASTRLLSTVAGNGTNAVSPDGTPAVNASLALPAAVSFDPQGNLLIIESYGYDIRRVTNGVLGTLAGNRGTTYNGDGQPATGAALGMLASNVTADPSGNLYFADGIGRVRKVDAVTQTIVTVAGSGAGAHLQILSNGSGGGPTTCPGNLGDNGPATIATLDGVVGVAFTSTGHLLMSDYIDCRVRSVPFPSPLLYSTTNLSLSGTTLTATVSPIGNSTTPTGTVQFMQLQYDPTGAPLPLASAPLNGGTATVDTSSLTSGSYQVMAIYTGDGSYNGSGSIAVPVTGTGRANPGFGASLPYPVRVSTPVTIPVTVTGSRGYATGSLSLYEGSTFLTTQPLVNGTASLPYSSSVTGAHQITVQYAGDSNYTSASWTFTITVLVPSTVTVIADKNPAAAGTAVTFTGAVSPSTATGRISFYDGGTFLGTATIGSGGAAALAVSTLTAGTHSITASYNGDFVVAPANSGTLTETITTATSVALTTSGSPSVYPQPVTFTAAVSPSTATGTVQFMDGATLLSTATLGSGSAQFTAAALTGGSHTITATYSGDSANSPATSAPLTQTVSPATPTVTISTTSNPTTVGTFVLFNMSITPRSPGAVLQVLDGQTVLATVTTSSTGGASFSTTTLTAGYHSITASWAGDGSVSAGTSAVLTEQIQASTTTSAVATGPVTYGQSVTVTATVSPATASGNVQFNDGGSNLGTVPLSLGVASITYVPSMGGTHDTVATFNDPNNIYIGSNSSVTFTVAKLTPVITVAMSPNPSNVGQLVTLTSTLSSVPDGANVNFYDGTTFIGVGTLSSGTAAMSYIFRTVGSHSVTASYGGTVNYASVTSAAVVQNVRAVTTTTVSAPGTSNYAQPVQLVATVSPATATGTVQFLDGATPLGTVALTSGSATLSVSTLATGSHTITAIYSGDTADTASTSAASSVTVSKANTTAAMSSSANPSTNGQAVTFSATLTPSNATGSVQFLDGATVLGTTTLTNGAASLSTSALSVGSHSITVSYAGDANCNPVTSAALNQTVNKAPSTTTLSASAATIVYGQTVDLTASVSPAAATGTVQFLDGATVLVTLPVTNGSIAVVTATNLTVGLHTFTAVYSGDAGYNGSTSSGAATTVSKAGATVALSSSANPSLTGQAVVFTAAVTPASATGSIQFLDGATVIGTAALSHGSATFGTSSLAAGSHSTTASYSGDANFNAAASAPFAQTVNKTASTTTLSASAGTVVYGQSVNLTASVVPAAATGTVQFFDGSTLLASMPVTNGSVQPITATNLVAGVHTFNAVYGGDAVYSGSTSGVASVTVSKASAAIGLSTSPNPSLVGQPVTFTAAVSPSSATGSVQFLDGSTVIGAASLTNGAASLSAALAVGTHSVSAVYSGDANYNGAASAAVAQTVNKAASTTMISAGSGTIPFGQGLTLTASVSPASATGTVQFLDGRTVIGAVALSGGSATIVVANLAVGAHVIAASYSGDGAALASTSGPVSVTVVKAATSLSLASSLNPSLNGQAVTFTAAVAPANATGTVKFQDGGFVIGIVPFTNGSASLTVSNLAAGSHSITAVYGGDPNHNGTASAALTQSVLIATRTALIVNKTTANEGQNVKFTATVSPGGATGNIDFMDGTTLLSTVPLNGSTAVLQVSNLAAGTHTVTATYRGAAKYASSTSSAVTVTIY